MEGTDQFANLGLLGGLSHHEPRFADTRSRPHGHWAMAEYEWEKAERQRRKIKASGAQVPAVWGQQGVFSGSRGICEARHGDGPGGPGFLFAPSPACLHPPWLTLAKAS